MEEQMEWLDEAMLADGFEADGWTGTAQEEADDTNAGREVPPPEVMDETQPLGMGMAGLTGAIV